MHLRNGYLTPEIYSKETDSHEYLHPASAHLPTVSTNNPYSVALRVRRNCSDTEPDDSLFVKSLIQYKAYLLHCGYDKETIDHGLLRAWNSVDLVPVNPKAAISSLHQVRIPSPR